MKTSGFEIPAEMKALAEQGIEATRQAFQGYLDATEKALGAFENSSGMHSPAPARSAARPWASRRRTSSTASPSSTS